MPLVAHHSQVARREKQGKYPVNEHQELGVGEPAPLRRAVIVFLTGIDGGGGGGSSYGSGLSCRAGPHTGQMEHHWD